MYTLQALWSQAREKTNVVTVICSNRKYFTIELESLRAGNAAPGKAAKSLLTLDQPALDWVNLSRGMGVPATSVNTTEDFIRAFRAALAEPGPYLIEVVLE
jgi:acetolactate synthase-1/2/3 large subunit